MCYKHWKFYDRMILRFGEDVVQRKLIRGTNVFSSIIRSVNQGTEKIECQDLNIKYAKQN
jgi:hypothetical protein